MLLNENKLYDNISSIDDGDKISIINTNGDEYHTTVERVTTTEILLKHSDKTSYTMHPATAINGNIIEFRINGSKAKSKTEFSRIVISDSELKAKLTIVPESEENPGGDDDEEIRKKLVKSAEKQRAEILSYMAQLDELDEFTLTYFQPEMNEDIEITMKGNGWEGSVTFEIEDIVGKLSLECTVVNLTGNANKLFNNHEKYVFYIGDKLFNNGPKIIKDGKGNEVESKLTYDSVVAMQILPKSDYKNPIILYHVADYEGEEGDETPDERSFEELLKDKNLRGIMNKQSAWDKLLGRKAVGVVPMKDLKNKEPLKTLFGFNKKRGEKVTFVWVGEPIKGKNIGIGKNKEAHGYMYSNDTIKISGGKNNPENIMITIGKMSKDNYYMATASRRDVNKQIQSPIQGKIQIIK